MLKSVADFKRALQVGTLLHTVNHTASKLDPATGFVVYKPDGLPEATDQDMGVAPVSIVKATQFAVQRKRKDGSVFDSYCPYPAASLAQLNDNSITLFEDCDRRGRIPVLTYTILPSPN